MPGWTSGFEGPVELESGKFLMAILLTFFILCNSSALSTKWSNLTTHTLPGNFFTHLLSLLPVPQCLDHTCTCRSSHGDSGPKEIPILNPRSDILLLQVWLNWGYWTGENILDYSVTSRMFQESLKRATRKWKEWEQWDDRDRFWRILQSYWAGRDHVGACRRNRVPEHLYLSPVKPIPDFSPRIIEMNLGCFKLLNLLQQQKGN